MIRVRLDVTGLAFGRIIVRGCVFGDLVGMRAGLSDAVHDEPGARHNQRHCHGNGDEQRDEASGRKPSSASGDRLPGRIYWGATCFAKLAPRLIHLTTMTANHTLPLLFGLFSFHTVSTLIYRPVLRGLRGTSVTWTGGLCPPDARPTMDRMTQKPTTVRPSDAAFKPKHAPENDLPSPAVESVKRSTDAINAKVDSMRATIEADPDDLIDKFVKFAFPTVAGFVAGKAFEMVWNRGRGSKDGSSLLSSIVFAALSGALGALVSELSQRGSQSLVNRRHRNAAR